MYVVFCDSPVSEDVVTVEDVFEFNIDHVVPLSIDFSISYPVMAEPPLLEGAAHERLICDDDTATAESPVGGCGMVCVVADTVFDGELVPTELIAETR